MESSPDLLTEESRFFLEPASPAQRQYEALRAYFLEGSPSQQVAERFGYRCTSNFDSRHAPLPPQNVSWLFAAKIQARQRASRIYGGPKAGGAGDCVRSGKIAHPGGLDSRGRNRFPCCSRVSPQRCRTICRSPSCP